MNSQQLLALLRTLIQMAVAYAVGRGWVPATIAPDLADQLVTLAAAVAAIGATAWGLYVRRNAALVNQAAAVPAVQAIMTDAATAAAAASPKVQPTA